MNEPQYLREAGSAAEIPSVNVGGSGGLAPSVVSIDAGTTTMPVRERREKPRISETPPVPPPPPTWMTTNRLSVGLSWAKSGTSRQP